MNDEPQFDWDDANTGHIWERHRLEPWEAEAVFDDEHGFTYPAPRGTEKRSILVGETNTGRLLAVVYTNRSGRIRVVTARYANTWEQTRYRESRRRRR